MCVGGGGVNTPTHPVLYFSSWHSSGHVMYIDISAQRMRSIHQPNRPASNHIVILTLKTLVYSRIVAVDTFWQYRNRRRPQSTHIILWSNDFLISRVSSNIIILTLDLNVDIYETTGEGGVSKCLPPPPPPRTRTSVPLCLDHSLTKMSHRRLPIQKQ